MTDRYLFENFVFKMEDEMFNQSLFLFAQQAENMVEKEGNKKITFNYYPQNESRLQLVIEAIREKDKVTMTYLKVHHTSPDVWKLKVVSQLSEHKDCYMVTDKDETGGIIVRLVNEQVLDEVKTGDIIEAQVVGLAMVVNIYENEESYQKNSSSSKEDKKILLGDGVLLPTSFMVNNNANLTEKERKERDHSLDNLLDFRGTIKSVWKYPLKMYDTNLNNYYMAEVNTNYGTLHIVIPAPVFPKEVEGFGEGNVIVGKILLSGDVCIYDYDKYKKEIKNKI